MCIMGNFWEKRWGDLIREMSAAGADNIFIPLESTFCFSKCPPICAGQLFLLDKVPWRYLYIGKFFASALWLLLEVCSSNEYRSYATFMRQCAEPAHLFLIGRMAGQLCHHKIVLVYSLSLFTSACFAPITSHVMSTKGHVTCQVAC